MLTLALALGINFHRRVKMQHICLYTHVHSATALRCSMVWCYDMMLDFIFFSRYRGIESLGATGLIVSLSSFVLDISVSCPSLLPGVDLVWPPPNRPLNVSISQYHGNGVIKMGAAGTPRWAIVSYVFHLRPTKTAPTTTPLQLLIGCCLSNLEAGWYVKWSLNPPTWGCFCFFTLLFFSLFYH